MALTIPVSAVAAEKVKAGDFWYYLDETYHTASVTSPPEGSSYPEIVVIPSTVSDENGTEYTVTSIYNSAFINSAVTTVTLPESITTIGSYAFERSQLSEITNVSGLTNLKTIGREAFEGTQLKEFKILPNLTSIGARAFYGSAITEIYVPATLTNCDAAIFAGCKNLTNAVFEEGRTSIPDWTFTDCANLTRFTIPSTVTSIGAGAFRGSGVTEISLPEGLTTIRYEAFKNTPISEISLPASLTKIEEWAFRETLITSVNVPAHVTTCGEGVFAKCGNLNLATIEEGMTEIPSNLFYGCTNLTDVTLPQSATALGSYAFNGCASLQHITIPENVSTIGIYQFEGCKALSDITMESVTPPAIDASKGLSLPDATKCRIHVPQESIANYQADMNWRNYKYIIVPIGGDYVYEWSGNEAIIANASWYTSLAAINLKSDMGNGRTLVGVGDGAFSGCTKLTELIFGDCIRSIGAQAFEGCTGLTSLSLPQTITEIGATSFNGCSNLTEISMIAAQNVSIGDGAFDNTGNCPIFVAQGTIDFYRSTYPAYADRFQESEKCILAYEYDPDNRTATIINSDHYKSFSILSIPDVVEHDGVECSVETISPEAFRDCIDLQVIKPEKWNIRVRTIGDYAFAGCTSLKNCPLDSWVNEIGVGAFSGCIAIAEMPFREWANLVIKERAFEKCTGFTTLTFTNGAVESIGDYAFDGCTALKNIFIEGETPFTISEHAFDGTNDCPIYVPSTQVEAYKTAWPQYAGRIASDGVAEDELFSYIFNHSDNTALLKGFRQGVDSYSLTSLVIPETTEKAGVTYRITDIDLYADMTGGGMGWYMPNLKELIVKAKIKRFLNGMGMFESLEKLELPNGLEELVGDFGYTKLTSVKLPQSLKIIGGCVFSNSQITNITVPSNVTTINSSAFYNCSQLTMVNVRAKTPPTLGDNAFDETTCQIFVPAKSLDAYRNAEGWSNYADRIFPDAEMAADMPISDDEAELKVGDTYSLKVIQWESSDPDVVTVDDHGNITAISPGEALITATTLDGSLRTGCFVTVNDKVTGTMSLKTEVDNSEITGVYDLDGIQVLGHGASIGQVRALPAGIYIVTTAKGAYKLKL